MGSAKTLKDVFNWYVKNWREGVSEMGEPSQDRLPQQKKVRY